ncbi:MAG: WecB/TagA/CpsF family glycosyltransferase [Armatimonadetes bacterium]|nr:WecB/TagA/CpsF family glycosyltransferase [Armatimonadota bacterium]
MLENNFLETKILGLKLNILNFEETLKKIENFIKENSPHLIVTLGVEMAIRAQKDIEFLKIINQAELVVPDTIGILWALRKQGIILKERVTGVELVEKVCQMSSLKKWKVYFLGGNPGIAQKAAFKLKNKYPDLEIAGFHHGYFKDDQKIIQEIKQSGAQILFLALGYPKQEKWYQKYRNILNAPVGIGVGGSLDVISGVLKRAPGWIINLKLEFCLNLFFWF